MDRGANAGLVRNDVRVTAKHPYMTEDIRGIDNHGLTSIPLVTTGDVVLSTSHEVIMIIQQCACNGKNKNIHLFPQIEHCKNNVDNRSIKLGSGQHMTILDNCKVPMSISND